MPITRTRELDPLRLAAVHRRKGMDLEDAGAVLLAEREYDISASLFDMAGNGVAATNVRKASFAMVMRYDKVLSSHATSWAMWNRLSDTNAEKE